MKANMIVALIKLFRKCSSMNSFLSFWFIRHSLEWPKNFLYRFWRRLGSRRYRISELGSSWRGSGTGSSKTGFRGHRGLPEVAPGGEEPRTCQVVRKEAVAHLVKYKVDMKTAKYSGTGAMNMEGTAGNRKRSGPEGHRFETRCLQELLKS